MHTIPTSIWYVIKMTSGNIYTCTCTCIHMFMNWKPISNPIPVEVQVHLITITNSYMYMYMYVYIAKCQIVQKMYMWRELRMVILMCTYIPLSPHQRNVRKGHSCKAITHFILGTSGRQGNAEYCLYYRISFACYGLWDRPTYMYRYIYTQIEYDLHVCIYMYSTCAYTPSSILKYHWLPIWKSFTKNLTKDKSTKHCYRALRVFSTIRWLWLRGMQVVVQTCWEV